MQLIMDQTQKTQGDFAATADSAANAQRRMAADVENLSAQLGTQLLPALETILAAGLAVLGWLQENSTAVTIATGVIGGLAAAVLVVNGAMKAYAATVAAVTTVKKLLTAATLRQTAANVAANAIILVVRTSIMLWTAAQKLLNLALAANPIGLVVTLIAALIGVLVTAYNKSEAFRNIVDSLARVLGGALKTAINFVTNAFDSFIDAIKSAWNWIGNLIDKIGNLLSKLNPLKALGNVLGGIGGKADDVRSGNQLSRSNRADRAGGTTGSGSVPVMVTDEQLARAITSLLMRSGVRNGVRPGYVL
jgi:hypothetical protein